MKRSWLKRKTPLRAKSSLLDKVRALLPKKNKKRAAKKYERNFAGDQSKRVGDKSDWIRGCPCDVTGLWPVDAAHVVPRGMGGAGGDATDLVPLIRECHTDYDGNSLPYLSDDQFLAKWGRTRESIRARAPLYEDLWQKYGAEASVDGLSF